MVDRYYGLVLEEPTGLGEVYVTRDIAEAETDQRAVGIQPLSSVRLIYERGIAELNTDQLFVGIEPRPPIRYLETRDSAILSVSQVAIGLDLRPVTNFYQPRQTATAVADNTLALGIVPQTTITKHTIRTTASLFADAVFSGITTIPAAVHYESRQTAAAIAMQSSGGIYTVPVSVQYVSRDTSTASASQASAGIDPRPVAVQNIVRQIATLQASQVSSNISPLPAANEYVERQTAEADADMLSVLIGPQPPTGTTGANFPPDSGAYLYRIVAGWKQSQTEGAVVAFIKSHDYIRETDDLAFIIAGSNGAGTRLEIGIEEVGLNAYDLYFEWDSAETGANTAGTDAGLPLNDGQWHCLVWQMRPSGFEAWVDGVRYPVVGPGGYWWADIQQSVLFNRIAVATTLSNGAPPPSDFFEGSLDELFFITRPLTESEIIAITNKLAGVVRGTLISELSTYFPAVWANVDYAFELTNEGTKGFGDEYIQNLAVPGSGDDWLTIEYQSETIQADGNGIEGQT